ncbi:MAG: efflux transporter outer membrane subunit [Thermodesulfobacteriota bacterium]|nr:efflux transporter outer membrane subunit [Thermodesulfobacteriota bacterium]
MKASLAIRLSFFMAMALSACSVGPEYERPELQEKKAWGERGSAELAPSRVIEMDWWTGFGDPYLDKLVKEAISGSFDLRILLGRIQEAGATIKGARAGLMPSLDLSTKAEFSRAEVPQFGGGQTVVDSQTATGQTGLSWEIDMWGKKRREYAATKAEYEASQADYRAGYLKLVSELALAYFQVRQIDEQSHMTNKSHGQYNQILTIYENQYAEGLIAQWKVLRQEAEVKRLSQELLELERVRKRLENRIATLLGRPAGDLKIPRVNLRQNLRPVKVPVGLPSDLLSRRPDIVAAEYRLIKATHNVGAAEAARLPSFGLTGTGSLVSESLKGLLTGTWALSIAPAVKMPLFDGGSRKADVAAKEARAQVTQEVYRKTVMTAFEEVENALVNLESRQKQKAVLQEKLDGLKQVRSQTTAKFELGLISQLEVLDIERELYASEKSLLEMHRYLLDDTVALFKAVGGGWGKVTVR